MKYLVKDSNGRAVENGNDVTDLDGQVWTFEYVTGKDKFGDYRIIVSRDSWCEDAHASVFGLIVETV